MSFLLATVRMAVTSSAVSVTACASFVNSLTALAIRTVLNTPLVVDAVPASARYTPTTCTRSPGLALSTRSLSMMTSTERGSWPSGERSGISCSVNVWWSLYTDSPNSVSSALPAASLVGYVLPVGRPVMSVASRYSRSVNECCAQTGRTQRHAQYEITF